METVVFSFPPGALQDNVQRKEKTNNDLLKLRFMNNGNWLIKFCNCECKDI